MHPYIGYCLQMQPILLDFTFTSQFLCLHPSSKSLISIANPPNSSTFISATCSGSASSFPSASFYTYTVKEKPTLASILSSAAWCSWTGCELNQIMSTDDEFPQKGQLHRGQALHWLNAVLEQEEGSQVGELDVGDFPDDTCPFVPLYIPFYVPAPSTSMSHLLIKGHSSGMPASSHAPLSRLQYFYRVQLRWFPIISPRPTCWEEDGLEAVSMAVVAYARVNYII